MLQEPPESLRPYFGCFLLMPMEGSPAYSMGNATKQDASQQRWKSSPIRNGWAPVLSFSTCFAGKSTDPKYPGLQQELL